MSINPRKWYLVYSIMLTNFKKVILSVRFKCKLKPQKREPFLSSEAFTYVKGFIYRTSDNTRYVLLPFLQQVRLFQFFYVPFSWQ